MTGFLSQFDGTLILDAMTGAVVDEEVISREGRPEWWVELHKTLESGSFERAQRHLIGDMGVEARAGDAEEDAMMRQRSDLIGYQRELALGGVVEWNLTDRHGDPLPYSNRSDLAKSIDKLPPFLYTAIHTTIARNNQPRTGAEKATFRDGPSPGAAGSDARGPADAEEVRSRADDLE